MGRGGFRHRHGISSVRCTGTRVWVATCTQIKSKPSTMPYRFHVPPGYTVQKRFSSLFASFSFVESRVVTSIYTRVVSFMRVTRLCDSHTDRSDLNPTTDIQGVSRERISYSKRFNFVRRVVVKRSRLYVGRLTGVELEPRTEITYAHCK